MCGRFTLTWEEWRRVAEALRIDDDSDVAAGYRPRFNIAPTDQHFIVTSEFERRRVQRARWGLVNRRATDNRRASQCINAKAGGADRPKSMACSAIAGIGRALVYRLGPTAPALNTKTIKRGHPFREQQRSI
jgi:putative SOS response-associated peptidase YedK